MLQLHGTTFNNCDRAVDLSLDLCSVLCLEAPTCWRQLLCNLFLSPKVISLLFLSCRYTPLYWFTILQVRAVAVLSIFTAGNSLSVEMAEGKNEVQLTVACPRPTQISLILNCSGRISRRVLPGVVLCLRRALRGGWAYNMLPSPKLQCKFKSYVVEKVKQDKTNKQTIKRKKKSENFWICGLEMCCIYLCLTACMTLNSLSKGKCGLVTPMKVSVPAILIHEWPFWSCDNIFVTELLKLWGMAPCFLPFVVIAAFKCIFRGILLKQVRRDFKSKSPVWL